MICPDSSARPRVKSSYSMENANKWSCHMCTYLNWPRAIRCTQCLSQRRTRSPTESPQSSGSGSRPVAFSVDPCEEYNDRNKLNTRTQHWTCSICTYENWAKAKKCVVCDHPRPNNIEAIQLAETEEASSIINEQDRARWRRSGGGEAAVVVIAKEDHLLLQNETLKSKWIFKGLNWLVLLAARRSLKWTSKN